MMTAVKMDPKLVPVDWVDHHLPSISKTFLQPLALRARFAQPLLWEPEFRREQQFLNRPEVPAAVLIAVVMRAEPTVLLTLRTKHLSTHSGQIAFPGGRTDATDDNATATALREAQEEVGLDTSYLEVLGQLPVYVTGSMFHVTPVVALVAPNFSLNINPHEVADVFEVPLLFLMNPAHHRHHTVFWQGVERQWLSMPYQDGQTERFIWGATAGILRNLYRFLRAV